MVSRYLTFASSDRSQRSLALALFIKRLTGRAEGLSDYNTVVMSFFVKRVAVELHTTRFQRFTFLSFAVKNVVQKNARIAAH